MLSTLERTLSQGRSAWLRGELDLAAEKLESVLAACPGLVDALYPLARAYSERGEVEKALATIETAIARRPQSDAGRLHRGVILLDHDQPSRAAADLEPLAATNMIARALRILTPLSAPGPLPACIQLPAGARWLADVAGRLLGLLEDRFFRERREAAVAFHQRLLAPAAPAAGPREIAFAAQRYVEVETLGPPAVEAEGVERTYFAFALIATGKAAAAQDYLSSLSLVADDAATVHFLKGVGHAAEGGRREAAWCFCRAARVADLGADEILRDLEGALPA